MKRSMKAIQAGILLAIFCCVCESAALRQSEGQRLARSTFGWEHSNSSIATDTTEAAMRAELKRMEIASIASFGIDLERIPKAEQVRTWYCRLPICNLHGDKALSLFTLERPDGCGGRMVTTILTMALADSLGMNFGGLSLGGVPQTHGVDFLDILDSMFGGAQLGDIGVSKGFHVDHIMKEHGAFDMSTVHDGQRVLVDPYRVHHLDRNFLREEFMLSLQNSPQLVQSRLMTMPLKFAQGRLSVAMHLRRGDLKSGWRVTPDDYYYRQVEMIRSLQPDADVHAFSALENFWKSSDFDGFREQGVQVHLDTDMGVAESWAHMAHAHVLIMSESSFSYAPAYMNPHCVIHLKYIFPSGPSWLDGTSLDQPSHKAELESCIRKARDLTT